MALLTTVDSTTAQTIAHAHGLGNVRSMTPVPAGSVNTNYMLHTEKGDAFLRVYEEQGVDGVAYEWALLDALTDAGFSVPRRLQGPAAGELQVQGKPIGLFVRITGDMICQKGVTIPHMQALGAFLGRAHRVLKTFPHRRESRFHLVSLEARLGVIASSGREDLHGVLRRLRLSYLELSKGSWDGLPVGVIHGDLFRDNVFWHQTALHAVLDWESASDGLLAYDTMVTMLAWSMDSTFRWDLAQAFMAAYVSERPMLGHEILALQALARVAALRFCITRLTDFELRSREEVPVYKDYRRFLQRLDKVESLTPAQFAEHLGLI